MYCISSLCPLEKNWCLLYLVSCVLCVLLPGQKRHLRERWLCVIAINGVFSEPLSNLLGVSKEFLDLKSTQGITHQLDFIRIKTFALKGCYEEDGKKKKAIDKRKYFQTTSDKELVSQLNSLENNPLGQKIWIDIGLKRMYRWQAHEKTFCIISH